MNWFRVVNAIIISNTVAVSKVMLSRFESAQKQSLSIELGTHGDYRKDG